MEIRKLIVTKETVFSEAGQRGNHPITRIAGIAVIANLFAGQYIADLSELFDIGEQLGELLMREITPLLPHPAISYGKAAIIGTSGDVEHAAAILHPKMGKPIRSAIGGGEAIIPSNAKVAVAGSLIDIPLGNKDNVWSFSEIDTMTVCVADAPRADEILAAIAIADGARINARVGRGKLAKQV